MLWLQYYSLMVYEVSLNNQPFPEHYHQANLSDGGHYLGAYRPQ